MSTDATNDAVPGQCDDCGENPGTFPTRIEDEPVDLCEDCMLTALAEYDKGEQ